MNENLTEEMLALLFRSRIRRLARHQQQQPETKMAGEVEPLRVPGRLFLDIMSEVKQIKVGSA